MLYRYVRPGTGAVATGRSLAVTAVAAAGRSLAVTATGRSLAVAAVAASTPLCD